MQLKTKLDTTFVRWFDGLTNKDVEMVGGKNASLGELIGALKHKGVQVPDGFATTSDAYWRYVQTQGLSDKIS
ncbi:MAG TPA: PEP/pyruvate-binding domain-containing protein, partial [Leptolyngbyaceae cyanobacterium]